MSRTTSYGPISAGSDETNNIGLLTSDRGISAGSAEKSTEE